MRVFTSALCAAIVASLFAGCASNATSTSGSVPSVGPMTYYRPVSVYGDVAPPRVVSVLHQVAVPDHRNKKPKSGIYVSQFYATDIYGYPSVDKVNKGPTCHIQNVESVNDVAVDAKGNFMDPDGGSGYLIIHRGPWMCSTKIIAELADTFGQPSDASTSDAVNGTIAVGNLESGSNPGNVALCSVSYGGCQTDLTNSNIYHAGGTVMTLGGDCFNDAKTSSSGGAALIYWKGCAGNGVVAKGFKSTYYGGMDIDNSGNLVVIDDMAETVTVYSGCNPNCKVVGGPFNLKGESFFGKLNKSNSTFTAVGRTDGEVDVYSYSPTSITFQYSFNKGLAASEIPDGIAVNPGSQK